MSGTAEMRKSAMRTEQHRLLILHFRLRTLGSSLLISSFPCLSSLSPLEEDSLRVARPARAVDHDHWGPSFSQYPNLQEFLWDEMHCTNIVQILV